MKKRTEKGARRTRRTKEDMGIDGNEEKDNGEVGKGV